MTDQELTPEAVLTISFSRTVSVKQYEPVQAFGAIKFGASTPPEQVELLLQLFDERAGLLAERVSTLADEQATTLRGGAPAPEPAPKRAYTPRQGAAPQRKANPVVQVQGIEFEAYVNRDGGAALKGKCQVCGEPAYFNPSVNAKTGVQYSAEQNVASALKFKGGIFCSTHRNGQPQARTAARQPVVEEAEDVF
jgi:hypothetical protein